MTLNASSLYPNDPLKTGPPGPQVVTFLVAAPAVDLGRSGSWSPTQDNLLKKTWQEESDTQIPGSTLNSLVSGCDVFGPVFRVLGCLEHK